MRLRFPTTCCSTGNRDVWLLASQQPIQSTDLDTARAQSGVTSVRVQTPTGQNENLAAVNTSARYLRVQSTASATSLGLAEVELVDTTAPNTSITSGPADGSTTNNNDPSFAFSGSPGADVDHFECRLNPGGSFSTCTSPRAYTDLADATHTFEVRAVDAAGNADQTPAARTFTVDTTAPDTSITSGPADGETITDGTPTFGFDATPSGGTFQCSLDTGTPSFGACSGPGQTHTPAEQPGRRRRTPSGSGRATAAGNTDQSPATRTFTVDTGGPQLSYGFEPGDNAAFQ